MINTVEIPVKYKFVIDRLLYEINIRSKNLAFMLHKNLDNPEFLDTELYARLENELIDVLLNRWVMLDSIFNSRLLPHSHSQVPRRHWILRHQVHVLLRLIPEYLSLVLQLLHGSSRCLPLQ